MGETMSEPGDSQTPPVIVCEGCPYKTPGANQGAETTEVCVLPVLEIRV